MYNKINRNNKIKDNKNRKLFLKNYINIYIIKNILISLKYNIEDKIIFYVYIKNKFNINNYKYYHFTYFKDFDMISGKSKSIITKYGLSRIEFRKLILFNKIPIFQDK